MAALYSKIPSCNAFLARLGLPVRNLQAQVRAATSCSVQYVRYAERKESFGALEGPDQLSMASRVRANRVQDFLGEFEEAEKSIIYELMALGKENKIDEAMALFGTVEQPSEQMQFSILRIACKVFKEDVAWKIFREFKNPVLPAYNLMLGMLCRGNRRRQVLQLFDEMKVHGIEPCQVAYTCLMMSHGGARDADAAVAVIAEMEAKGFKVTETEFGAALAACGKSGAFDQGSELMAKMEILGLEPNVGHFTSLMLTCSRKKDEVQARKIWDQMIAKGVQPNVVAYTCLASTIEGDGSFGKLQALKSEMTERGIRPHVFFYAELLRNVSIREDFVDIIDEMRNNEIKHNSKITRCIKNFESQQALLKLPAGWEQAIDPNSGKPYYWREGDHSTVTWERPT